MPLRSSLRRRGSRAYLVAPALLFLLTQACSSSDRRDSQAMLAVEFPRHAPTVLQGGSGFVREGGRFVPQARPTSGFGARTKVELPADGAEPIVFRGANGFEARVREIGADGEASVVDQALAYPREGGVAYWTTISNGVEEWLHLAPDHVRADRPAVVWQVTGAAVRQRGKAVELADAAGVPRMRVTAPVAFGANGRRIGVRLAAGDATVELFVDAIGEAVLIDPMWIIAGSLTSPLYDHRDATLGDGKILIAGGTDGNTQSVPTAMIYDPIADAWADTMPMNTPRNCHTGSALTDGSALYVGGIDPGSNIIGDVEQYDEATGAWSYVPSLNLTRMNHRATRLTDGTVFVTGGRTDTYFGGGGEATKAAKQGPSPQLVLLGSNASPCYPNNNVAGFGANGGSGSGGSGANTTQTTELFDPTFPSVGWQMMSQMNEWRERHSATLLQDGQVLVAGGSDNGFVHGNSEVYDPFNDNWNYVYSSLWDQRQDHTATLLNDGTVLVSGGSGYFGNALDTAEIFVPNLGGGSGSGGPGYWFLTGTMTTPRTHHTATLLPDGMVLVAGGNDGFSSLNSAEIYDPLDQSWFTVPSMSTARAEHTATPLSNGYVLVSGGIDDFDDPTNGAEIYMWANVLGTPCESDSECQSAHCSDGVCCDSDCTDNACTACTATLKGGGVDGVCGPAAVGTNPHFDCVDDGMGTCGQTGVCNGSGACELYAAGSICDTAYCQGNFVNNADVCDGNGTCVATGSTLCDPGLCNNGVCVTSCVDDSECATGAFCGTGNTCAPQKPVGQPAVTPNECQSGYASDGVCCDSACGGTCTACSAAKKGNGVDGVCGAIKVGTDPDAECPTQSAASCGTNGACDGNGACGFYAAGTVCSAASCVGSTLVQPSLCDGSGTCVPGGALSCDPAGCAGGACLAGCSTDPDCVGTAYCAGGNCAPQKPLGQPATTPNQCLSGHIADGVCCNVACTGTCVACTSLLKGGGIDGVCGPSLAGTDPDNECANQGAASCGTNGSCDGNGACARYTAGTQCGAASCQGNTLVQPSLCDGNGTCVSQGSATCSPGVCAGGTCQAGCAQDPDCVSTAFCSAGNCAPKKPTGQPATTPNQCLSGHIADGVCCDVACVGTCIACTATKKGNGIDGACGPILNGGDPDLECTDQGAASCGATGSCNGAGACTLYPSGTVCSPGACAGSTVTPPSLCDGAGFCIATKGTDCAPAACVGGTCNTTCTFDTDCITSAFCGSGNTCTLKKPLGQPATAPNECLTGFLADGICCNTACNGSCVACTNKTKGSGPDGTCGPIQAGSDPDAECVDQGSASCGTNGVCDGQGACALYGPGTTCAPGSCQGNTLVQPNLCDGSGTCVVSGNVDCSPASCVNNACDTSCIVDADCPPTTFCSDSLCAPKKNAGELALGGNECLTGFSADGVCCTSACQAGPCDACSVAAGGSKDGDCTPLTGPVCDDGDACTLVDECAAGVCQGSNPVVCSSPDECHDAGTCDPISGACNPVPKPNGSACDDGNPCTTDACQTGTCTGVSKLDGTPCAGGVCIAGGCVLDPTVIDTPTSSSGGGSGTATGTGTTVGTVTTPNDGSGGEGGNGDFAESKLPNLVGGGCLSVSPAEERPTGTGAGALLFALLAALRRRRGPRDSAGSSRSKA